MSKDDLTPRQLSGCFVSIWSLLVASPMWLFLMYAIISSVDDLPSWAWPLFWCYIPVVILGVIFGSMFRLFDPD